MRTSTGRPTKEEAARIVAAKEGACLACYVHSWNGEMPVEYIVFGCDYNHCKSGNIRRGHMFGFALCPWHHRAVPGDDGPRAMLKMYGPSLAHGSRTFREFYGSDDELIDLQTELIKTNEGKL
jgi:RecA-dependent nuclease